MRRLAKMLAMVGSGAIVLGCPGDDGSPSDGSSGPTSGAMTSGTTVAPETSDSSGGSTAGASSGESSTGLAGSSDGSGDSSTGGNSGLIDLINDGWRDNSPVAFQEGFVQDECWASTYVPEPEHYPFVVTSTSMLVGGDDMGDADFYVGVWSVDAMNQPETELASGTANVSGVNANLDQVPLDIIGASPGMIESGNFAIVVCLSAHSGFPGIARDHDGLQYPDRNWIRLADGTWVTSDTLGLEGDWIMRATITTM